ncbi:catalase [Actinoplanes sp. RD1]|uniref:catalase n=1 Tax=Actinoplanes sp. RD1 TaxID=3064538 RepID=UPI0027411CA0|nr:catalase [Actinoplanes sp. RD1]
MVDGAHEVFGFHPGYRALHADGRLYRGSFTALPIARHYTRAAHLQGETVPATVRFSKGGGNPDAPFGATVGMATRFYLPNGRTTNLVMLSQLLFPARRPEDLLAAIALAAPAEPGGPLNKAALAPFLAEHPEVGQVLQMRAAALAPTSFAHSEFHAVHVFRYVNADDVVTNVRCHWVPHAGVRGRPVQELAALSREALLDEFDARLSGGGVRFGLVLEIAVEGDPLDDATALWPADRQRVAIGTLEITAPVTLSELGDPEMNHDPTKVTDGIELNDDPILQARRGVYEVSAAYRTGGWHSCPFAKNEGNQQ